MVRTSVNVVANVWFITIARNIYISIPDIFVSNPDSKAFLTYCFVFKSSLLVPIYNVIISESNRTIVLRIIKIRNRNRFDCQTNVELKTRVSWPTGNALSEHAIYDEDGRIATASMLNFAIPRAYDILEREVGATVTSSPRNELGVKGIGESGTIVAPPAVVNAVVDALSEFKVRHLDMPITEETVWRAIRES